MLAEGSSIRAIERMTNVHRDTIMRLGVRVGEACTKMLDEQLRELSCRNVEIDEMWGFIGKKQRNVVPEDAGFVGDVWTYVALDADTKLVPVFEVGKRDWYHTEKFMSDLARRVNTRIQITTDGMNQYLNVIAEEFGDGVDYAQIVKVMSGPQFMPDRKYSAPYVTAVKKKTVFGTPDENYITTSHVEKQNLTIRTHCRRLTRLTNAFSKKIENFRAAIGLHFAYYNFVKVHTTIRCAPAMEAGISNRLWKVKDLVELAA